MEPRHDQQLDIDESEPLARAADPIDSSEDGAGRRSTSIASTTSFVLEHASKRSPTYPSDRQYGDKLSYEEMDMEDQLLWKQQVRPVEKKARRVLYILIAIGIVGWIAAFFLFLGQDRRTAHSARPHDPHATSTIGHGKKVTLDQVLSGDWYPSSHAIRWILGPNGEDGLLLERGGSGGRDYLVVEDVRYRGDEIAVQKKHSKTLMRLGAFSVGDDYLMTSEAWPSPDHKKVLIRSNYESNWRHSGTGRYWIFDVETQTAVALHESFPHGRVQLASWSPDSKSIVFARDNNLFLRQVDTDVKPITTDGGPELFYGVPDWVYEEEVLAGNSATWWSGDGKYIAFFRTDERAVPSFPVQYFFSRPSGKEPEEGEENYPETREIKYPKAGAPMSVVSLQIYDVGKDEVFTVTIDDDFADNDRLITEVIWAGSSRKLIVRETNRESDILKTILIDAVARTGRTVRERDVQKLDGGWFEVTESTTFIPADPANGREHDGYIDTVIHNNWDHLAYFTPLDNPDPIMLTEGEWEVVKAPSAVDVKNNLVYFISTQDGSTQRHVYTVNLLEGPKSITPVTDTTDIGYYSASFSAASKFVLLSYQGPHIPWQKILSTPSNGDREKTNIVIETNERLNELAKQTELPIEVYDTFIVDGFPLNVVERRPPHFDERKKYPVLFFLYNGPGAQEVSRRFSVDFQSYVASSLGYIVVTVDGRGTGYLGRKHRCAIRGNIGYWEAHDQIATAKEWAKKKYVNEDRMAIWGWSYGGFMTLKVLETDAGETFKYGMAVAPVTDWRYYDSVYTERYMHTPQHNPEGYDNATISNMTAISQNVRFLVMHGASDDNVHFQNTLSLLDKLDVAGISNYDVHIFPDSDHSIYFHNGNKMVYNKLSDWLINAFNGEWLKIDAPQPIGMDEL